MTKAEIYSKILEVSEKSYYRWKSKDHPILINLIEKYFSDNELEEFLETKRIEKFEEISDLELLNKTFIEIYNNFISKLYRQGNTLKLFLSIIYKSISNKLNINLSFIELIFDEEAQKEDKINLLNEFQKIQDTTLFFYSIKHMLKNEFKYIEYSFYSIDNFDYYFQEINFKIYNIKLYLEIFLKKEYLTFDEYIKDKNTLDDEEEFENFDLKEINLLSDYYEYLSSLVSKEKNNKVKINIKPEIEYLLPDEFI